MRQKWTAAILLAGLLLLGGCVQQPQQQSMDYIGSEQAKTLALQDAGLGTEGVSFSDVVLDKRNGVDYYDVAFTAAGQDYAYDIDALTGVVIQRETPAPAVTPTTPVANPNPVATTPASGAAANPPDAVTSATPQRTPAPGSITAETAKEKALAHAGLTGGQVTFVKAELDWDDGKQTYDVEFYTADYKEYDYEIDALTGAVVSYDYDADDYAPPSPTGNTISADKAKQIALAQVPGAAAGDIREFETDYDDGRMAYEGKIIYSGQEYEFEIDGYSGAIRSWDVEPAGH